MTKVKLSPLFAFLALIASLFSACSGELTSLNGTTSGENEAIIIDREGTRWDVTHARDVYDMNPDYFNYSLGFGAISSVDNPELLVEGDIRYPTDDSRVPVFGVNLNGEQRAYNIGALTRHEVFNDIYPGEPTRYVAVAY